MKLVFVSNFFNHHQAPLSEILYELTGGSYRFITTTPVPQERKELGYADETAPYVIHLDASDKNYAEVQKLIDEADAVILGSAPECLLRNRIREKKLIWRYSERPLKNGFQWWKYPFRWLRWHQRNPYGVPIYMLCASAYTAADYAKFGLFRNKVLKWGYFPKCRKYENIEQLIDRKDATQILWCGRFLDWKHPDAALKVAKRLKDEGYRFRLDMIGTGEMEQQLHRLSRELQIDDVVSFHGSKTPEEVRNAMERAGIYLFTSDRKEGWGAVLNEAMNSGCAVIASLDAGSTPYLVEDGENGLTYASGNDEALYRSLRRLLDDPQEQKRLGRNAYCTILREWNPETAAERLYDIFNRLLEGRDINGCFEHGPCSRA